MTEIMNTYAAVVQASAVVAALTLIQLLVSDFALISRRHVPGTPVEGGHRDFMFRAVRAHANSLENLGVYVLLALVAVLSGADARWAGMLAWAYAGARIAHMTCYYADWRIARSIVFSIGVLAQLGLTVLVLYAAF